MNAKSTAFDSTSHRPTSSLEPWGGTQHTALYFQQTAPRQSSALAIGAGTAYLSTEYLSTEYLNTEYLSTDHD